MNYLAGSLGAAPERSTWQMMAIEEINSVQIGV
jgi:hypothetical protein